LKAFLFFILIFFIKSFANAFDVEGIVKNRSNNLPVEGVVITDLDQNFATLTNQFGGFKLNTTSGKVKLIFKHLAFFTDTIEVNSQFSTVYLKEKQVELQEITFFSSEYALRVIHKVIEKLIASHKHHYHSTAFYRQNTKNDSTLTEIQEIFFEFKANPFKILASKATQGRYAIREGNYFILRIFLMQQTDFRYSEAMK
jgi:hypothetical protein